MANLYQNWIQFPFVCFCVWFCNTVEALHTGHDILRTEDNDHCRELGRVVRKPVNANPGLKVNYGNNFLCIEVLSITYVSCSLKLLMLKTERKKNLNRTLC